MSALKSKAVRGPSRVAHRVSDAPTARTKAGKAGHLASPKQETPTPPRTSRGRATPPMSPKGAMPSPQNNGVSDHHRIDTQPKSVATPPNEAGSGHAFIANQKLDAAPATNKARGGQHRRDAQSNGAPSATSNAGSGRSALDTQKASAPSGTNSRGRGHSGSDTHSVAAAPASSNVGGGQTRIDNHNGSAPTDPAVPAVIEPYLRRRSVIAFRIALSNQLTAYARQMLGYNPTDKASAASIVKRASALVAAIMDGEPSDEPAAAYAVVADMAKLVKPSIDAMNAEQKRLEKTIVAAVEKLRVYPWASAVRGFGDMGLAAVVGECGDLGNYANPAKVWKRMGLAVFGGKRQGAPGEKATAEDWIEHGYSKARRSVAWNLGEPIVRGKAGVYRDLYVERKKLEMVKLGAPEGEPCGHANNRAKRWMVKRLLRDLWREWRKTQ